MKKELHIKHTRLVYDTWNINQQEYYQTSVENEKYAGYLALLKIVKNDHVSVWSWHGKEKLKVSGKNVRWLMILPKDCNYCIKMMLNPRGKCFLWYIDMIDSVGVDSDGIYYFNDLFLDLLVHPSGEIVVGDRDELDAAYEQKIITKDQYEKAIKTAEELMEGPLKDIQSFKSYCYERLHDLNHELGLKEPNKFLAWIKGLF